MSDALPGPTSSTREDLETSNRSVLLQAEQSRKILRILAVVPDQPGAPEAISLLEELLVDSEERRAYVAAAREKHASDEGDVEVDEEAVVSIGNDGAYVQAWTWVPKEN
jgi:hypothetical protein